MSAGAVTRRGADRWTPVAPTRSRRPSWPSRRSLAVGAGLLLALTVLVDTAALAQTSRQAMGYYRRESDEASRQRMMASFRRDAEVSARRREEAARSAYRPQPSGGGATGGSRREPRAGTSPLPSFGGGGADGPAAIESTTTVTVRVRESESETAQRLLREAAGGEPEAMWNAGRLLFTGGYGGVARDDAKAMDWFRRAAQRGHGGAATALGEALWHGHGVTENPAEAVRWFRVGADAGVPRAQLQLGSALLQGRGAAVDREAGRGWLDRAAAGGEPLAQWIKGSDQSGRAELWPADPAGGRALLQSAAAAGVAPAMRELAELLFRGHGGPQDQAAAVGWWARCAPLGESGCPYNLAVARLTGAGGSAIDVPEGLRWLRTAAEGGDVQGQFHWGRRLLAGEGVAPSVPQAVDWLRRAAEQGHGDAAAIAAEFLGTGQGGVTRDPPEALRLARRGAEAGSAPAAEVLGTMLMGGRGVAADLAEAARWNRMAAEGGRWAAQYRWGWQLKHGQGVPVNLREARRWLETAAGNGIEAAREELDAAFLQAAAR